MSISPPVKIEVPFGTGGLKNTIPAAADPVTGNAGYSGGFPAINMTPKVAGGIPPFGEDFNGIFFDITTAIQFLEAGGSFPYDSTYATAVGGYPIGALVSRTDSSGLWRNTVANNTTDPETFGAGWQPEDAGSTSVTMTNANVTLTALQSAKQMIIITGALVANLQLIMPAYVKQWLIVNNCTGAFTITVKTAAGSGIAIATASTQAVYGDGTNVGAYGQSTGRLLAIRTITTTSAYTETAGTKNVFVRVQGSGGAGGGVVSTATGNTSAGLGGSAGAYVEGFYPVATLSGLLVTIGAGGVGAAGAAGGNGATTSFGGVITAPGGVGGSPGQNLTPPWLLGETGNSAIGTGGNLINSRGVSGGQSFSLNLAGIVSGRGGSSPFGAGGNQVGTTRAAGNAGTGPGAGGSGALEQSAGAGGLAGGNGIAGVVELWEFA